MKVQSIHVQHVPNFSQMIFSIYNKGSINGMRDETIV
jgi:hypothetical protein